MTYFHSFYFFTSTFVAVCYGVLLGIFKENIKMCPERDFQNNNCL